MDSQVLSNSGQQLPTGTKRIEYIDALRGFTIFLVVLYHVAFVCFNLPIKQTNFHRFFVQVRMPMFFLISGFVLYKSSVVWNARQIVAFFRKKIPVQLLSPLLFFVVFMHVWTIDYRDGFFNDPKYGYWFTYVLFIYYVIYAVVRFIIRTNKSDIVLLVIGICLLPVGWPRLAEFIPVPVEILSFLSFQHWKYFLFFVLGTLLK